MQITWLGHSAFRIDTGKAALLIDPFLSGNPTFEKAGLKVGAVTMGVTHVAITHGHGDHIGDAAAICRTTGAMLIAAWEICTWLGKQGVERTNPANPGGEVDCGEVRIALTPAWHSSSMEEGKSFTYLGNPCGLVITSKAEPSHVVYAMGDTGMSAEMALTAEFYRPTIGFVPIGDRFTMGARQAAFACKKFFEFKMVLPCHYGTFGLLDQTADRFVAEMKGHKVLVPKAGETVEV
jgi:L-ascorbate metabolism protein UlaG (beta-lactamase superfamily)